MGYAASWASGQALKVLFLFSPPELFFRAPLVPTLTGVQGAGMEWQREGLPQPEKKHPVLTALLHSRACLASQRQRSFLLLACLLSHFSGGTGSSWFLFPFCASDGGMDAVKRCFYGGETSLEAGAGCKVVMLGAGWGPLCCPHPQPKGGDLLCPHPPGLREKTGNLGF